MSPMSPPSKKKNKKKRSRDGKAISEAPPAAYFEDIGSQGIKTKRVCGGPSQLHNAASFQISETKEEKRPKKSAFVSAGLLSEALGARKAALADPTKGSRKKKRKKSHPYLP